MSSEYATARELDQLRSDIQADLRALRDQVARMDGSTQIAGVQGQLGELRVQLGEHVHKLDEMSKRQTKHAEEHERERHDRVVGRRWAIGIAFAAIGSLSGLYAMLAELLGHAH